jgi:hypothetical protein
MIWSTATFKAATGVTVSDAIVEDLLTDADYRVQAYITDAAYADADADTPDDAVAARLIRKAIKDLTLLYLRRDSHISPVADEYEERYAGNVKAFRVKTNIQTGVTLAVTEKDILATLSAYAEAVDFTPCVARGSGRFVSASLLIDEDEDDA